VTLLLRLLTTKRFTRWNRFYMRGRLMSFEMIMGLFVLDQEKYAKYRAEIAPLLQAAAGRFVHDFEVARTLKSDAGHDINRWFMPQFPDRADKGRFFKNPQSFEIRARLFAKAGGETTTIAEYEGR